MAVMRQVQLPKYDGRQAAVTDQHTYYRRRPDEEVPQYIASPALVETVNMAKQLGRPLLLEGEPGCGKTSLARHVAWTLDAPYFEWHVKSTDQARRGLYIFDTIARLRDAQLAHVDAKAKERVQELVPYVITGSLGKAFESDKRAAVVLIDEIDKADSDFPNDLLLELDRMSYVVAEISEDTIDAKWKPLIFVTSNREKPLPRAFLRRCLYYYIEFPDEERLRKIIAVHGLDLTDDVLDAALVRFLNLRTQMREGSSQGEKVPDVAEMLDWLNALSYLNVTADDFAARLPASCALLKTQSDTKGFETDG